ncbi:MAG: AbrB/MazE/SpoVT family DNA-binding domain-containing protein [Nitrososphaerota archaeon]|nr:AbrB/MazE/SpoVT family DNA-binding domain-containing protein [Nitrososphaerota archaeon]MDG7040939.1 AbrB/MazE/SpoVT family DNA-binding domain-containing protein [Nitrososphaerota archaeon]MDG7043500.1 AbrB/MazE/SpoVT family DNA-binding domain-containing protein [Nitrososphaerota archaeon]
MLSKRFRVMRLGRGNAVITLPALWRASNGINPGDLVEIEFREHELIIRPAQQGAGANLYGMGRQVQNPDFAAGLDTAGEKEDRQIG